MYIFSFYSDQDQDTMLFSLSCNGTNYSKLITCEVTEEGKFSYKH